MKLKLETWFMLVSAATFIVAIGIGVMIGRDRPRMWHAVRPDATYFFGWDEGNHCVAAWVKYTNGVVDWTQLEPLKK